MKCRNIILWGISLSLTSCGFSDFQKSKVIAQKLEETIECQDFEPFFWHALHDASLNSEAPKSWKSLKKAILERDKLENEKLIQIVQTLEKYLGDDFWRKKQSEQLEIWAQLELKMEDREGWADLQSELGILFESQVAKKSLICDPEPIDSKKTQGPSELGGRWVMATAYQSCVATQMPAITASTPDAEGIKVTGQHPAGGSIRIIDNLKALQATHPYLRIQNKESDCFNVEAKPLIYDFGGKPGYASSGGREMNLFKNSGSGSQELGIDCSGLVFASLGVQGLRLIPNQDMVAGTASGFGSSSLLSLPKAWKCLDRIQVGMNQNLKAGDIMSIKGHTVLIDELGDDPWGMRNVDSKSECERITEDDLDFIILQSSPSKGAVGINRYQVQDYLKESSSMKNAFLKYAKAHCVSSFDQKVSKPVWGDASIIRHKGTPECLGRSLTLKAESCLSSCSAVIRP